MQIALTIVFTLLFLTVSSVMVHLEEIQMAIGLILKKILFINKVVKYAVVHVSISFVTTLVS